MPFKKGQGGRPKGVKNKPKPVSEHLIAAFERRASEADYNKLVEAALGHAIGDEIITENEDGTKVTKKIVSNPDLLKAILPIVASKMPERKEVTGEGGGPIIIKWQDDE